ncbi:MAG: hypothetical protein AABZ27_06845 [Candidatus Omnitrophota bacterium]
MSSLRPKILIVFGIALAFMLYLARVNLRQDWNDLSESVEIWIDNFNRGLSPDRSRPISTLSKEEELKMYVGAPFLDFQASDWDKFWNIVYGLFPVDYSENERLPPRSRHLTNPEMQEKLKELYPSPFGYFQDEHWEQFWRIIFKTKAQNQ